MSKRTSVLGLALAAAAAGLIAAAQPAREPAKPAASVHDIKSLAFLQGTWSGAMEGDPVEETWSAPKDDSIIGMFRWQSEGKTTMWELLCVKQEEAGPTLRLRHFNSDFTPWKGECDKLASLPVSTLEKNRVVFTNSTDVGGLLSCEYDCRTADVLKVTVSFRESTGRPPLKFELAKAK